MLAAPAGPSRRAAVSVDTGFVEQVAQRRTLLYDKSGEEHYNLISALHKSMRNSDPDAAVYWLARMLEAGEDPLYIARRLVRFASEDVGIADPQALVVAMAAQGRGALHRDARGEHGAGAGGDLPGDRAEEQRGLRGYQQAAADALRDVAEPVPLHLRNAPTRLMKDLDYGEGLPVRARRARRGRRHGLPAREPAGPPLLPPDRARVREGDQAPARRVGGIKAKRRELA